MTITVEKTIAYLMELRKHLVHALKNPRISPAQFNDARQQLAGLDVQLRQLGKHDMDVVPQMNPSYTRPTRAQRRNHMRGQKYNSIERRLALKAQERNRDES
jgi:hypothetical protein